MLTCPVLSALRAGMPEREIVYVGRDSFGELARVAHLADRVISEDSPEAVALHSRAPGAGEAFSHRAGPVALAVSFLGSPDVTRNLLGAGAEEVLVSAAKPAAGVGVHAADHLISVLKGRLDVPSPARPRIKVPAAVRESASAVLREAGVPSRAYLVIQPGSGSPGKNWPAGNFRVLASLARDALGLAVVIVLGPAELERDPPAIRAGPMSGASAPGQDADDLCSVADAILKSPRLPLLAALLADAAAYVGNDSGVSHLAAACGAPTVAVFGPSDPAVWAPRGARVTVVRANAPGPAACTGSPGDLRQVEVEDVLEALRALARGRA